MATDGEKLHIVYLNMFEMMNLVDAGIRTIEESEIKSEEDEQFLRSALKKLDKVAEEVNKGKWKLLPDSFNDD